MDAMLNVMAAILTRLPRFKFQALERTKLTALR